MDKTDEAGADDALRRSRKLLEAFDSGAFKLELSAEVLHMLCNLCNVGGVGSNADKGAGVTTLYACLLLGSLARHQTKLQHVRVPPTRSMRRQGGWQNR